MSYTDHDSLHYLKTFFKWIMNKKIKLILENLPKDPWVYLMKDKKDNIIYVWKSVNLKSRVSSYFNWKSKLNFAKVKMVEKIENIDYIITKNEVEALVLETNLIKKHSPKYNILMKDDKNLIYIKLTQNEIPEVYKVRKKTPDWTYFWPYTSTTNVAWTLKVLKKVFKIRNCRVTFWKRNGNLEILQKNWKSIPCMDYYIWVCSWPCLLEQDKIQEYKQNIENFKNFMNGKTSTLIEDLNEKMKKKAANLEFEEAAKLKEQIRSITSLWVKQMARDTINWDNDIFVCLDKYDTFFVWVTQIRDSQLVWVNNFSIENKLEESKKEIIANFLQNFYIEKEDNSKINLITLEKIEDEILLEFLKSKKISVENPSIWNKIDIINFTKNNLLEFAYKKELSNISKLSLTKKTQINILEKLWYKSLGNKDIIFECYDISHIAGNYTVASRSVIVNGKSDSSKYKRYKLKTIEQWEIDDFKSMNEILGRRTLEAIEHNNWPDLIIIDGWKGQLSSAIKAIKSHIWDKNISFPNICSLAKREEEVFLPNISESILLEKWTPELSLIQKIRDEAHRFAIEFNRSSRIKWMKKTILEEVPGLWEKTIKKLLKKFGSLDGIKEAWEEDLSEILTKTQLENLKNFGII